MHNFDLILIHTKQVFENLMKVKLHICIVNNIKWEISNKEDCLLRVIFTEDIGWYTVNTSGLPLEQTHLKD